MPRKSDLPPDVFGGSVTDIGESATIVPEGGFDAEPPAVEVAEGFGARYRKLSLIGEGGMGAVQLCRDAGIGRDVAMKVIRDENAARGDQQERFVREARIQGQLEHPAIVPVYDLGRDPSGSLYFTMKRVRGLSLREIIDGLHASDAAITRSYSRRRLLGAFASVCLAVDFAHSRGFIHRDLKPENVMLGDYGEMYVLDWGLARHMESVRTAQVAEDAPTGLDGPARFGDLDAGSRTAHGVMMGTPGYMSPEQVRGDHQRLDARSDVYSLGAILFELLALEALNRGHSVVEAVSNTLAGVDARFANRPLAVDVPPELEAICVKATQLDPRDRFPTARALHDAIERFLDGDRDVARRRELAAVHAAEAEKAATEALATRGEGATRARSRAMREVGRALALDPDNSVALQTMMRLLTVPPTEVPPEVESEMLKADATTQRAAARFATGAYLAMLGFIPLALIMGVRQWPQAIAGVALFLASAVVAWFASRRSEGRLPVGLLLVSTVAVAATARVFGPFTLLPALAAIHGMGFILYAARRHRVIVTVLACMPIVIPALLEWAGVLSPTLEFDNGAIRLLPNVLSLPPTPTWALLLCNSVAEVLVACLMMTYIRKAQSLVERRLQLTLWQLRQLVGERSGAALKL